MIGSEDFARFEAETAGVSDPIAEPIAGEVIPPGQPNPDDSGLPLEMFITEELVAAIFSLPGNMMARKTGHDHWRIEEEESELLGKTCTPGVRYLVQKYLSSAAGPLTGLGAGLGVIYGPKIMLESLERKRERKNPPSANPNGQSNPQQPEPQQPPYSSEGYAPSSASEVAGSPQSKEEFSVDFRE